MPILDGPRKMSNAIEIKYQMGFRRRRFWTLRKMSKILEKCEKNRKKMSNFDKKCTFVDHIWHFLTIFVFFYKIFDIFRRVQNRRLRNPIWHFISIVLDIFRKPSKISILTFFWHFPGNPGKPLLHWGRPITDVISFRDAIGKAV